MRWLLPLVFLTGCFTTGGLVVGTTVTIARGEQDTRKEELAPVAIGVLVGVALDLWLMYHLRDFKILPDNGL